jgi:tetratricopeptide (TPR) repeat protein
MSPLAAPLIVGDRFELLERAGSGGMGVVYRARDLRTGQPVALKVLAARNDGTGRFLREAKLLSGLRHPGIVAYLDHGFTEDGAPFLAMEWLSGEDLSARLRRGSLSLGDALDLLTHATAALATAHARGVIHRDLKPSNLFLRGGRADDVAILDFGLARALAGASQVTHSGAILGTPAYMAPEQARGERDLGPAADVFSLGCVLYECLAGQSPFFAEHPMAVMARILFGSATPIRVLCPAVPEGVAALLARMLARDPAARPPDAAALLDEVERLDRSPSVAIGGLADARPRGAITAGEQRLVSVVVASRRDLATGSTVLLDEVGTPAPIDPSSMKALGARVEWLADGSLVASIGEGGGSAEDQAVQAARCALAVQERWPESRVALATGRGAGDGELPIGEALDRAAELLTAPGQAGGVRVDAVSAALLERRFVLAGEGAARVLKAERVSRDEARPLLGKPTPCVGRDQELGLLSAAIDACFEEPSARAILITAPPGVGKSRLRRELLRRLSTSSGEARGVVLVSYGDPLRLGSPYGLVAEALLDLCKVDVGAGEDEARARLAERLGENLAEGERERVVIFLAEVTGARFPHEAAGAALRAARQNPAIMAEQIRLALSDLLRAECRRGGVLWVLEDLHWADAQSVHLVGDLVRELEGQPLMILALSRPEIAERFPRLWEGISQQIPLRGLGKKAGERLVREVLEGALPEATVARLVEQAAGNVLFLEELIRAEAEGKAALDDAPLATVLAMLQARLSRLPSGVRRALRAASVFGHQFWRGGVQALLGAGEEPGQVEEACRALALAEIVERTRQSRLPREEEYRFRHALMREAAYALLTDADRATGHRLAGWYLEQAGEKDPLILADHYRRAGELRRVIPLLLQAGEAARRLEATADARRHFTEALELLERLGEEPGDRRLKADTILRRVRMSLFTDPGASNLALLQRARELLDDGDEVPLAWADYLTGRIHYLAGNPREAIAAYSRVLPVGERVKDPELVALPSVMIGAALFTQGHLERAERLLQQSLGPLSEVGLRWDVMRAHAYLGAARTGLGRVAEGAVALERAEALAAELGQLTATTVFLVVRGGARFLAGDWPGLAADARRTGELGEQTGETVMRFLALEYQAWAATRLGRPAEGEELQARAARLLAETGGLGILRDWSAALGAEMALGAGRAEEALARAREVAASSRAGGLVFSLGLAERVAGEALAQGGGAAADVDRHMEESVAALARGGLRLEIARTRLSWALLLRRRGEAEAALAKADQALAALREAGSTYALEEAERRWRDEPP